jgi:hypothetical protein
MEDLVDTGYWIQRGETIRSTICRELTPVLATTEEELRKLLGFVVHVPVSGMNMGAMRKALFIPFGGPCLWNKKVALLLREIEYANDRHCGKGTPVPDWEWKVAGLDRPLEVGGGRVVGVGENPPDLPGDPVETV